jgi:hypothetical protein
MKDKIWAYLIHLSDNMWADYWEKWHVAPFYDELSLDENVWRKVIDFLPSQGFNTVLIDVGDAMEYERHPEISVKGAWSKDKLRKELNYIRSLGMTPLPKLNFSACHDAWLKQYSWMLSTPTYYQVCKDLIEEVVEVFDNPEYFHLGMDEENAANQKSMAYCCIRQKDLWWHDAYFFFDICERLGMRPWVWADFCWHEPEAYLSKMPKSVLQSNWAYNAVKRNPDGTYPDVKYATYVKLEEAGFDQVPTSSTWTVWYNSEQTMELGKEVIAPERLFGYMTAPWHCTRTRDYYYLLHDAYQFGIAKNLVYPEE